MEEKTMIKPIINTSDISNTTLMLGLLIASGITLVIYLIFILVKKNKKDK